MSRLDAAIRRLQAQRICSIGRSIRSMARRIILELGLGNGLYGHLRKALPGRRVFDRNISPHPDCVPPDEDMYLGEMDEMLSMRGISARLPYWRTQISGMGIQKSAKNVALIGPLIMPLLRRGAIVISDRALTFPEVEPIALPEGMEKFGALYRAPLRVAVDNAARTVGSLH